MSNLTRVWPAIERVAREHHVIAVGAADLQDDRASLLSDWLDEGREAGMGWLRRNREVRLDPATRFSWAKSAIVILVPYSARRPSHDRSIASRIARYALGDDYHEILDEILRRIEDAIRIEEPNVRTRRYVDTGPLSDRGLAARAGLGWIGKNSMLIHPEHGSWTVIGTLLTSLANDVDSQQIVDQCGTCTRCVDACPTRAILPDRTVDSRLCISYWTIEHRGPLDDSMRDHLDGNVFGCDTCNEVCPWNESTPESHPSLDVRERYAKLPIHALLTMDQAGFSNLFRRSAVKRAKRSGVIRNSILVTGKIPEETRESLRTEEDPGIVDALEHVATRS